MTNDDKLPDDLVQFRNKLATEYAPSRSLHDTTMHAHRAITISDRKAFKAGFNAGYDNSKAKIKELEEQVSMLKECVMFYADRNSWTVEENWEGYLVEGVIKNSDIEYDRKLVSIMTFNVGGKLARETLARLDTASSQEE